MLINDTHKVALNQRAILRITSKWVLLSNFKEQDQG